MDSSAPPKEKGSGLGIRHVQVLLLFFHLVAFYYGRMNASISIVAMTDAATTNPNFPEYAWTEGQKGYILSTFFWGYIITQFPSSFFIRYFGVKLTLFVGQAGTGLLSLFIPMGVEWGGWKVYCAIRVVQGMFQGVLFPSLYAHLATWSPREERTRLGAIAHFGMDIGSITSTLVPGLIAASDWGWPGISYVACGCSLTLCVFWVLFGSNNANESRFISTAERDYIESSLQRNENFHKQKIPVPWKAIFTSVPFYSHLVVRTCSVWGYATVLMELPLYLNGVIALDIKENAIFSALPYIVMFIMSNVNLVIADVILQKNLMSLTTLRKTFNTVAFFIPAILFIAIGFLDKEHKYTVIALFTVAVGIYSGITIGTLLNIIDLSPNHAGMIMGFVNPLVSCIAIIVPNVVAAIIDDKSDRQGWQIVFALTAVILIIGNLQYLIWGTTDAQPWNDPDYMTKEKNTGTT